MQDSQNRPRRSLRRFRAEIKFEVKIGQILSVLPPLRYYNHYHIEEEWKKVFTPSDNAFTPKSHFTNFLTNNGAEVDHILNLKHQDTDLLFEHGPLERLMSSEFQCQTRSSNRLILQISSEEISLYSIRRRSSQPRTFTSPRTFGTECLHCDGSRHFFCGKRRCQVGSQKTHRKCSCRRWRYCLFPMSSAAIYLVVSVCSEEPCTSIIMESCSGLPDFLNAMCGHMMKGLLEL